MGRLIARVMLVSVTAAGILGVGSAGADPGPQPVRIPPAMATRASSNTVVVARGDHLWKISERHLDLVLGRRPQNSEISPYWRRVIEANRPGLRSGDPDLIYPGEIVTLPELAG